MEATPKWGSESHESHPSHISYDFHVCGVHSAILLLLFCESLSPKTANRFPSIPPQMMAMVLRAQGNFSQNLVFMSLGASEDDHCDPKTLLNRKPPRTMRTDCIKSDGSWKRRTIPRSSDLGVKNRSNSQDPPMFRARSAGIHVLIASVRSVERSQCGAKPVRSLLPKSTSLRDPRSLFHGRVHVEGHRTSGVSHGGGV